MANKPTIKNFYADSGTIGDGITDANVITLTGTADANATVNVYDGSTLLGSAKTNGSGIWLFETPKLSDSAHSLTATATDASGTSAASAAMAVTVVPSVTDFRSASDNWQNPIKIDGQGWFIESPNKAWSVTNPDPHTVRMEVRPGDEWADDGTARSEILTVTNAEDHQVFNASYTMTIEPGQINNVAWLSLTQMHEDVGIPFSIQLVGDHMTVLTDQNADWGTLAYSDPNAIVRGHAYDIQIRANFSTDSTGFLQIWRDGVQIVDYHGQLGSETGGQYLKLGIYEGWPENVSSPTAVDYSNIVVQYNNPNVATPSAPGNTTPPPVTTPPTTPAIANFSTDSGVAGDRITNDSTLTLTGTATANSTVKVFDGSTQVGTATADTNGAWSVTTSTLTNGGHSLTATATNSAGTSSASTALSVTIDTVAPTAPTLAASTPGAINVKVLAGSAEANSTVKIFDGTTQIGTATANGSGAWTYTTSPLSAGNHSFTAKAMDVAGNTGAASTATAVTIPQGPAAPTIATFSDDTGVAGDRITSDNTLTLTGTAAANSTVNVYDGSTQIGTATADANGAWNYITSVLSDAVHNLTATATNAAGGTSGASAALSVTIDTRAPNAPTIGTSSSGVGIGGYVNLAGSAEANSTVKIFDGTTQIGTVTANGSGAWAYTTAPISAGNHSFTAKAMDAAGNTGAASAAAGLTIAQPSAPVFNSNWQVSGSGDFGGNGKSDILWRNKDGSVSISDDGGIANAQVVSGSGIVPNSWHIAGTGDFNGNGKSDILWQNSNGSVSIWDDGAIGNAHIISGAGVVANSWQIAGTGDFNGNGKSDILWQNSNGSVSIWDDGAIGNAHIISGAGVVANSWHIAGTGDFDGNGKTDILWRNDNGSVSIWDDGAIGKAHIISGAGVVPNSWHIAGTGDFDGNGTTDILWRNDNGSVSIWDDGAIGKAHIISGPGSVANSSHIVGTGDYDGNGKADILWRNDDGSMSIWDNGQSSGAHAVASAGGSAPPSSAAAPSVPTGVGITDLSSQSGIATIKGTADAGSLVKVYDGTTSLGSATAGADGSWTFTTSSALSNTVHKMTAQEVDSTGHVVATSSGAAILGASGTNTITGTTGDDVFVGNGGQDTFVFASNFGHDVIKDFVATGTTNHDVLQFSTTVFDSFASVLAHASQVGSDVVISSGSDTLTLKNTAVSSLDNRDFHFV